MFPDQQWQPISVADVMHRFVNAPFEWGLAGGYAVEQFLGTSIRAHEDIDIIIFRDEQHRLYDWLDDWHLYASDPPGHLRKWLPGEWLPVGIHDIWGYADGAKAWQLQVMVVETEGDEWVNRRHSGIRGPRHTMLTEYSGVPSIRIEFQLLYKALGYRDKDRRDFDACLPLLSPDARQWLQEALQVIHPSHVWIDRLNPENDGD